MRGCVRHSRSMTRSVRARYIGWPARGASAFVQPSRSPSPRCRGHGGTTTSWPPRRLWSWSRSVRSSTMASSMTRQFAEASRRSTRSREPRRPSTAARSSRRDGGVGDGGQRRSIGRARSPGRRAVRRPVARDGRRLRPGPHRGAPPRLSPREDGILFSCSCSLGALCAGADEATVAGRRPVRGGFRLGVPGAR